MLYVLAVVPEEQGRLPMLEILIESSYRWWTPPTHKESGLMFLLLWHHPKKVTQPGGFCASE
jgi:hypothetical protein